MLSIQQFILSRQLLKNKCADKNYHHHELFNICLRNYFRFDFRITCLKYVFFDYRITYNRYRTYTLITKVATVIVVLFQIEALEKIL
ncbi:unnamed protein product [Rhizophagus irregularis]|nr:unnamed protein product [Rhizophagus irregularis]